MHVLIYFAEISKNSKFLLQNVLSVSINILLGQMGSQTGLHRAIQGQMRPIRAKWAPKGSIIYYPSSQITYPISFISYSITLTPCFVSFIPDALFLFLIPNPSSIFSFYFIPYILSLSPFTLPCTHFSFPLFLIG